MSQDRFYYGKCPTCGMIFNLRASAHLANEYDGIRVQCTGIETFPHYAVDIVLDRAPCGPQIKMEVGKPYPVATVSEVDFGRTALPGGNHEV